MAVNVTDEETTWSDIDMALQANAENVTDRIENWHLQSKPEVWNFIDT